MDDTLDTKKLKDEFLDYLGTIFLKNLNIILAIGIVMLCYYTYSDWSVRPNVSAVRTRIIPLVLCITLLFIHLVYKHRFLKLKETLYVLICLAIQLMMYAKCLIHLHTDALAPSVTGAILVVFIISLDIKLKTSLIAFIYFFPILLFTLFLLFFAHPTANEFLVIADVYPIVIIGFVINRMQFALRFRAFKSNWLLNLEQAKTQRLYQKTLEINTQLEIKASEAVMIKEEIQLINEELNISNATKDRFLEIIAHDLRSPIGTICSLSDILLMDDNVPDKEKRQYIKAINTTINQTYELLDNLLTWARAQKKSISYEPKVHSINTIISNEIKILSAVADKKLVHIKNQISDDFKIYADLNMFRTIIRNIVSNAIKFTYKNGHVILDATIITENNTKYTEITISDNGMGMTEDRLLKIFTISDNVSTKGTENEPGTGLGLLLCKEFITQHKGSIKVECEPNKGCVFKCRFPVLN